MRKADLIGGTLLAAFSLALIFIVIPYGTEEGQFFGLSPVVYPTVMASGMGLCAIGLIVQSVVQAGHPDDPIPITRWQLGMFVVSTALVLAGVFVIERVGILIGGPLLIAGFMVFLGERKIFLIAVTSIAPVALLYVMATYVLKAPLP